MDNAKPNAEQRDPKNSALRASINALKESLQESVLENPGVQNMLFQQIIALIKSWFKKKNTPDVPPPVVVVTPGVEEPKPEPKPQTNPYASIPAKLELKIKGVKRNGKHLQPNEVKAVRDLSDPVNVDGDIVNLDCSPFDAHGEKLEMGSIALEGLLKDPSYGTYLNVGDPMTYRYDADGNPYPTNKPWPVGYDNHRAHLVVTGPADQGGEYRNYAMGINLNATEPGDISAYVECKRADGVIVRSNTIQFRAKWWGE